MQSFCRYKRVRECLYTFISHSQIDILPVVKSSRTDPDHLTIHIQHSATRTAMRNGSRKLDHIHIVNLAESGYNTIRNGIKQPQRTSNRHNPLTAHKLVFPPADIQWRERPVNAYNRQIKIRVIFDQFICLIHLIVILNLDRIISAAARHMIIRQYIPVRTDHNTRTRTDHITVLVMYGNHNEDRRSTSPSRHRR